MQSSPSATVSACHQGYGRCVAEMDLGDDALHPFGQDTHGFSLNSFTHAYSDVTNGRFEAAPESKIKNAKQIVLYALGFLCFSQKLSGKIFNLFRFCVFPCFLNVGIIKSKSDCYFHFLPSNWVKTG
jgi:hypothetical protein